MGKSILEYEKVKTQMRPLSERRSGDIVYVSTIYGGKGARKKLFDLGIIPGVRVEVVQGARGFPYILRVGGTRIMIGWGMVQKILVTDEKKQ